jgi:hypothetical protein
MILDYSFLSPKFCCVLGCNLFSFLFPTRWWLACPVVPLFEEDRDVYSLTMYVKLWCSITTPFTINSGTFYDVLYSVFDSLQHDISIAQLLRHWTRLLPFKVCNCSFIYIKLPECKQLRL